ncbi:MAG TPA: YceI family protein, partial [bacterium]|nr:YceI family protein [bacterium]
MKNHDDQKSIVLCLILLFSFAFFACNRPSVYEIPKSATNLAPDQALASGQFRLIVDASMIQIRVVKDDHIPVRGTFNLSEGQLVLKSIENAIGSVLLDITSWDSGLSERDAIITKLLLQSEQPGFEKASLDLGVLPKQAVEALIKTKRVDDVTLDAVLLFKGNRVSLPLKVKMFFDERDRFVVQSVSPSMVTLSALGLKDLLPEYI